MIKIAAVVQSLIELTNAWIYARHLNKIFLRVFLTVFMAPFCTYRSAQKRGLDFRRATRMVSHSANDQKQWAVVLGWIVERSWAPRGPRG